MNTKNNAMLCKGEDGVCVGVEQTSDTTVQTFDTKMDNGPRISFVLSTWHGIVRKANRGELSRDAIASLPGQRLSIANDDSFIEFGWNSRLGRMTISSPGRSQSYNGHEWDKFERELIAGDYDFGLDRESEGLQPAKVSSTS